MTAEPASSSPTSRPWWQNPMFWLFGFVIFAACTAILSVKSPAIDPTKPAPLPGGGSFCDTPAPTKSTLEKPKPIRGNEQIRTQNAQ